MQNQSFLKSEWKLVVSWLAHLNKILGLRIESSETETVFILDGKWLLSVFKYDVPKKEHEKHLSIPLDFIINSKKQEKLNHFIKSNLLNNKKIFARNCTVQLIKKEAAFNFCEQYHLLGGVLGAFNYGLFYKDKLLAVAVFSKGRKMNRLPESKRSFELMRYVNASGVSIAGGLSKLLKQFERDKQPGDIMTYIDRQFFSGSGFLKIGFQLNGETEPHLFFVDENYERHTIKTLMTSKQKSKGYQTLNAGNYKLVKSINH